MVQVPRSRDKETEAFLAQVLPQLERAETALHNGDASPRRALWSHDDPVTLFGAVFTAKGWGDIGGVFDHLASRFSACSSWRFEIVAAGASGDLGYLVGIEKTTASVGGAPPQAYELRVTTVFRREGGAWKVVHRHGDPVPDNQGAREQRDRLGAGARRP